MIDYNSLLLAWAARMKIPAVRVQLVDSNDWKDSYTVLSVLYRDLAFTEWRQVQHWLMMRGCIDESFPLLVRKVYREGGVEKTAELIESWCEP